MLKTMKVAVQAEAQNKEGVSERQLVVADRPCWAELRYRPQYGQCDTVHNMDNVKVPANARSSATDPAQQVERSANGVHPAEPGQAQIADALWSWLKFRTSLL